MTPGTPLNPFPLAGAESPVPWALSLGRVVSAWRTSPTAFTYVIRRSGYLPVEFTLRRDHGCVLTWRAGGSWGLDRGELGIYSGHCSSDEERVLFGLAEQAAREAAPFRGVPARPGTASTEWTVRQARSLLTSTFFHSQPFTPGLHALDIAVKAVASRLFDSPLRVLRGEARLTPSDVPGDLMLEMTLRSVGSEPLLMADPLVASSSSPSGITMLSATRNSIWTVQPGDVSLLSSRLEAVV